MSDARFKNHFDMISLHEPVTRKAKFWQSYVRALKGTDDMRADDSIHRRPRFMSEFPSFSRPAILEDYVSASPFSAEPSARIHAPGYRYLPVSRETYGYSPRNLYGWDRPSTYRPNLDEYRARSQPPRATSVPPPMDYEPFRASSLAPRSRGRSLSPVRGGSRARSLSPLPLARASSVPPTGNSDLPYWYSTAPRAYYPYASRYPQSYWRPWRWDTCDTPSGRPHLGDSYWPGGVRRMPYLDMLEPSPYLPISAVTRDPWWYDAYGTYLRPYGYIPRHVLTYPSALRNSYLSPVRNNYLWSTHPLRPL